MPADGGEASLPRGAVVCHQRARYSVTAAVHLRAAAEGDLLFTHPLTVKRFAHTAVQTRNTGFRTGAYHADNINKCEFGSRSHCIMSML